MTNEANKPKNPLKIGTFIGVFIFLALGKSCISDYGREKQALKKIPMLETMLKEKTVAIGQMDPQYKEVTIKIMHLPVKHYEVTYHYTVNGSRYDGEASLDKQPVTLDMPLYYYRSNPSISSFDPAHDIEIIRSRAASRASLYWGLGWIVFGLLAAMGALSEYLKYRKAKRALAAAEEEAYRKAVTY